jgi:pyruvate dehydrogenase E2 component (dihydrolipoamide acetyltransferase)
VAEFTMPSLGADMDAGTVIDWLVKPGDRVQKGDIVAVVDTAKAAVEVECFVGGTVERLVVPVGQRVPVGTTLAIISTEELARGPAPAGMAGEPVTPPLRPAGPTPEVPAAAGRAARPAASPLVRELAAERGVDLATVKGSGRGGAITRADVERAAARRERRPVSPRARRLAAQLGVDLGAVTGTGPDGAVRAEDVEAAAAAAPREARAPEIAAAPAAERAAAMRQAIAALMAKSKREIPHYYLSTTVDMSNATKWLRDHNRALPVSARVVPAALLIKATARAVLKVPQLNGFWVEDQFVPGAGTHIGVAISIRGGGLVAPAIHDAADLSVDELMDSLRDLVSRARAGRLRSSEMSDPTITVTNLGEQGVESVLGVIYPPQVALVGFGKVVERPYAVDGLLGIRPVATLTLSGDHRATDGFTGARFLDIIDRLLQQPEAL